MPHVFVGVLAPLVRHQTPFLTHLASFPVRQDVPASDAGSAPLRWQVGQTPRYAAPPADASRLLHPSSAKGAGPC
jgi:hypothetical protein